MEIIGPERVAVQGVDPSPAAYYWALISGGVLRETGRQHGSAPWFTTISDPRLWVIEWPCSQGTDRALGQSIQQTLVIATGLRDALIERQQVVYCPTSQRIRYDVAGYSTRRDGAADKFIRAWLIAQPPLPGMIEPAWRDKVENPCGGLTNVQLRDAFMAALWGEGVRTGKIDGSKWRASNG